MRLEIHIVWLQKEEPTCEQAVEKECILFRLGFNRNMDDNVGLCFSFREFGPKVTLILEYNPNIIHILPKRCPNTLCPYTVTQYQVINKSLSISNVRKVSQRKRMYPSSFLIFWALQPRFLIGQFLREKTCVLKFSLGVCVVLCQSETFF